MNLKFNSEVRFRSCAGENLILLGKKKKLSQPVIYQVNETGKFICDEIKNKQSLDQLIHDYSTRFSLSPLESQNDVLSYLDDLRKYNILEQ